MVRAPSPGCLLHDQINDAMMLAIGYGAQFDVVLVQVLRALVVPTIQSGRTRHEFLVRAADEYDRAVERLKQLGVLPPAAPKEAAP
jgi:hypothetical protein